MALRGLARAPAPHMCLQIVCPSWEPCMGAVIHFSFFSSNNPCAGAASILRRIFLNLSPNHYAPGSICASGTFRTRLARLRLWRLSRDNRAAMIAHWGSDRRGGFFASRRSAAERAARPSPPGRQRSSSPSRRTSAATRATPPSSARCVCPEAIQSPGGRAPARAIMKGRK